MTPTSFLINPPIEVMDVPRSTRVTFSVSFSDFSSSSRCLVASSRISRTRGLHRVLSRRYIDTRAADDSRCTHLLRLLIWRIEASSANPLLYGVAVAVMNRSGFSQMLLQRALLDALRQSKCLLHLIFARFELRTIESCYTAFNGEHDCGWSLPNAEMMFPRHLVLYVQERSVYTACS